MFWIALAAQVSAPVPLNLNKWFYADDTPQYLIAKENGLWFVAVRLSVSSDGVLRSCDVESTSGIPQLDSFTCRTLEHRAKFKAARWADGSPAYGVYRTSVQWAVSAVPWDISKVSKPDLDVDVQSLPPGVHSPALVHAMFAVDAAGQMSACISEPSPLSERADNPALVQVACDQLMKSYKAIPATGGDGKPVVSVQDALVRFSTAKH
jgi:hypothetical protein